MKVKELIEQLSQMPQDSEVVTKLPDGFAIIRSVNSFTYHGFGKDTPLVTLENGFYPSNV